ncbi:MAG: hypothetical protein JRN35_04920 [Nitrososphaerota archaeon]|nr:hypothetical protein [Nitrososphaerota archaeon]
MNVRGEKSVLEGIPSNEAGLVSGPGDLRHLLGVVVVPPCPRAVGVGSELVRSYRSVTHSH